MSKEIGQLVRIFVAPEAGAPMQSLESVRALGGRGLEGDRYSISKGHYPAIIGRPRHVSLISREAIIAANKDADILFDPEDTRRNLIVSVGFAELNTLIAKNMQRNFMIGDQVRMRGVWHCKPCHRPTELSGKGKSGTISSFKTRFDGMGGIRAIVLESGVIGVGDKITIL